MSVDFQVNRDDFHACRFVASEDTELRTDGEVLLTVDRFAFTSNNISYAVAGDMLDYWSFFPGAGRWGRIPVMGFGDVAASRHPDVAEGARFFGFFPMSSHLKIHTERGGSGMVDTAPHRAKQAATYRSYLAVGSDPLYDAAREDEMLLLRGLFLTSFLIDDFLADSAFFGARATLVTSASSKTSIALAHQLRTRARGGVVGLTSHRHRSFVESLGCYDRVSTYEEIEALDPHEPAVLVDMAGNGDVTGRIHRHFDGTLAHSCIVGMTHWQDTARAADLPGPPPEFFFAPGRLEKRSQQWGPGELHARIAADWAGFVAESERWLRVVRSRGEAEVERVYGAVLAGLHEPRDGHILSLCPGD